MYTGKTFTNTKQRRVIIAQSTELLGTRGRIVVKELDYKPEGRWSSITDGSWKFLN